MPEEDRWRRDATPRRICLCDHPETSHRIDLKRSKCEEVVDVRHVDDMTHSTGCGCMDFSHAADEYTERRTVLIWRNEISA